MAFARAGNLSAGGVGKVDQRVVFVHLALEEADDVEFFGIIGINVGFNDAAAGHGNSNNFDINGIFYVLCVGSTAAGDRGDRGYRGDRDRRINCDFSV